ncbi:MAG: hypothetical protein HY329_07545 [Chloroflexi bacterium]|nr:hypothetical protein [Chloroflexota bacterium]
MADLTVLDRAFTFLMGRLIETGRAPHYTDLARHLGCSVDEGRAVLRDLMKTTFPGWLHPRTDYIVSFPPLNAMPTQYRITVGGNQRWTAQCGFEALAVTWLFPRQLVRIDAPCLDCNEPIRVEMRDGQIQTSDPSTIVGHLNIPYTTAVEDRPFM